MQNLLNKLFYSVNNIVFSYLIVALIFIVDLLTPLGYAVWILYLIPLHTAPYKSLSKNKIYLLAGVCSAVIWIGYFLDKPGIPTEIARFNRILMTIFYWVVAYSQVQKHSAFNELTLKEDKLKTALGNLMENQFRFERAEQLAHVGSWVMDAATGEMQLSAEMVKLIGLSPEVRQINIREYLKLIHPEDLQRVSSLSSEYHREGRPLDIEYRIIRQDGQIRYIRGLSSSDKMDERKHIRYGAAQDITERKLVEIKLAKTQAQLIEAQRLASIGNFSVNYQENGTVEWSEEMFRIYEREIQKGAPTIKEAFQSIHTEDVEKVKKAIQVSKEEKKTTECVYRIITGTNKIKYLHSIFSPMFDSSGKLVLMFGTSLDVTENMKQQITIRDTLKKLQRSNKELEQFAYVASHDLQEPLRMVSSYMGMLEKKYSDRLDSRARQFIHFAVDGSKRMGSLIKDLLIYSRISSQAREFTEVDMNKIYKDVVHDLQVLTKEKQASIKAANLPVVQADSTQMHQLLLNLIGNAIKFHGENKPEVTVDSEENENGWVFSVRDNGIGIENAYYDRIFQVFQRLHDREKYAGTGIGLAVCQKIVERHGGRIWVESEVGKGTTFHFMLSKNPDSLIHHKIDNLEIFSGPAEKKRKPHRKLL